MTTYFDRRIEYRLLVAVERFGNIKLIKQYFVHNVILGIVLMQFYLRRPKINLYQFIFNCYEFFFWTPCIYCLWRFCAILKLKVILWQIILSIYSWIINVYHYTIFTIFSAHLVIFIILKSVISRHIRPSYDTFRYIFVSNFR